jgi:hypothetical protein
MAVTLRTSDVVYLYWFINLGLLYRKSLDYKLVGFCDVDYAGDKIEIKSTSGNYQFLGENQISWTRKRQTTTPSVSKYMSKSTTSHMPMHNFDR